MTKIDKGIGIQNCRVALTGASGSGKSTLARYISEEFGLKYIENSAGNIMDPITRDVMMTKYGWKGSGHQEVINLSSTNPEFGKEFQREVLRARARLIASHDRFVFDRSPLDNLTYFALQYGHNATEKEFNDFLQDCITSFKNLDCLIFVRMVTPDAIENNGSRIDKRHYQGLVDNTFHYILMKYLAPVSNIKILTIDFWDSSDNITYRKKAVKDFIQHHIDSVKPTI